MMLRPVPSTIFFFNATATTEIYTLSLHDALPISARDLVQVEVGRHVHVGREEIVDDLALRQVLIHEARSEEHTSELQSQSNLVCRLLLEKKKKGIQEADRETSSRFRFHAASPGNH